MISAVVFYTNTTSLTLSSSVYATLKFDTTTSSRNVAITGFSYNSGTGLFTNSSGGTLVLSVNLSVAFNANATGTRSAFFYHYTTGYISYVNTYPAGTAITGINTSAIIYLLNGESFECQLFQSSGGTLGTYVSYPVNITSLSIYQL